VYPQSTPPTQHHVWLPIMLIALVLPFLLALFYFNLAANAFQRLGLSPNGALLVLVGSLIGSMINIPITRRKIVITDPRAATMPDFLRMALPIIHYYPPATQDEVIAINVGGALVPISFSIYLIHTLSDLPEAMLALLDALVATVVVIVITKLLARPVPGVGITLPSFVAPIIAALTAFLTVHFFGGGIGALAPVAYIAGALGTLIGADLLNLPLVLQGGLLNAGPQRLWGVGPNGELRVPPRILSIGGAGVFDGIFLTAVIAPLLASLVPVSLVAH